MLTMPTNYDAIDSKPVDFDFSEGYDPDGFSGWNYTEAVECDECGQVIIYEDDHADGCETEGDARDLYAEGPMMNYFYPVEIKYEEAAARDIVDLPLCVVNINGVTGLALTGGGMDLSWEIAEAFIRLGFYPPVHFARLPIMAGHTLTPDREVIIKAMAESVRTKRSHLNSAQAELDRVERALLKEGRRRA